MIVGLTGGIASGKSTVSKYLAEKGFKVYDADRIAKDISEKKLVQEEIILNFGDKILTEDGKVDRKKLKEIVFCIEWLFLLLEERNHWYPKNV